MASIKLGAIITDIRGKIGGMVFSRNAGGSYSRNLTVPVNPNTTRQQTARSLFSQVTQAWKNLTVAQRDAWIAAAAMPEWSYENRIGEKSQYTGSQLFVKLNNAILQGNATATILTTPPNPIALTAIHTLTGTAVAASSIELVINGGNNLPAGQQVKVYSTGPVSPGVYRPKNFKWLQNTAPVAFGSVTVTTSYTAAFGTPVAGQVAFFKVETFAPATGQSVPGTMVRLVFT